MPPDNNLPFNTFGLILLRIFLRNDITYSKNSGRNWSKSNLSKFCRFSSFVKGLTKVIQSRSLKKAYSRRRTLFFWSTCSLNPFWRLRARSKYSLDVIYSPS